MHGIELSQRSLRRTPGLFVIFALLGLGILIWKISGWKTGVDNDRSAFKEFMQEIREKINEIFLRLPSPKVTVTESPLRLSKFGKQLAEEIKAEQWVPGYAVHVKAQAEGMKKPLMRFKNCAFIMRSKN